MNLEPTSPWIRVELSQWGALLSGRTPVSYQKKALLYHQGDAAATVYIVETGRIRVTSYQQNGGEKQLYIAEQGALFGCTSCFNGCPHNDSAVAIVDSSVYCIPFWELESAIRADYALCRSVISMVCRTNSILFQQVVELSFSDALQRIVQVLLNLGAEYGIAEADGVSISIRFTHQDVANLANTSRVTVSNIFHFLTTKGLLKKKKGHYILHEEYALRKMAEGSFSTEKA